jgi:uncharacterized protein (DUF362 family)
LSQCDVWIQKIKEAKYPNFPYNPPEHYPEFIDVGYSVECDDKNSVYSAVREVLHHLEFDKDNYGTKKWNPLGELVKEGETVVIKPNFVRGTHIWGERGVRAMITNASVIRPIIDYVLLAINGKGKIIIGDAPIRSSDWNAILESSQIQQLVELYKKRGYDVRLIDFRKDLCINNADQVYEKTIPNPTRKINDYIEIDIKADSMLNEIMDSNYNFEMGGVKRGTISKYHRDGSNTYLFPREVLEADLFINVPKLKTHRMAGLTCAMKNLIGINGEKERIAHYRRGVKSKENDEFEAFHLIVYLRERVWNFLKAIGKPWSRKLMTFGKRLVQKYVWKGKTFEETYALNPPKQYREGGWHGNDTLWRCAVDINRILLYADKQGKMQKEQQRKYICLVDAIIAGEGEGPLATTPKDVGIIFGGENPVMIDFAAASIMNFDYQMMPMIRRSFEQHSFPLINKSEKDIHILSNVPEEEYRKDFIPTSGWQKLYQSYKSKI